MKIEKIVKNGGKEAKVDVQKILLWLGKLQAWSPHLLKTPKVFKEMFKLCYLFMQTHCAPYHYTFLHKQELRQKKSLEVLAKNNGLSCC